MATITAPITVKQWLELPAEEFERTELIDGEIVRVGKTNSVHEKTKSRCAKALTLHLANNPVGEVYVETCFELTPEFAPMPDVSVLMPDRKASPDAPFQAAPEIVIEVVSSEDAKYLVKKLEQYFAHGARLVAAVYPEERIIWVYRPDGTGRRYSEADRIEMPDLLQGFSLDVKALFSDL